MLIISNVSHKDLASYQCKTQSGARSKFQVIQQVPPVVKTTEKSPTGKLSLAYISFFQKCFWTFTFDIL